MNRLLRKLCSKVILQSTVKWCWYSILYWYWWMQKKLKFRGNQYKTSGLPPGYFSPSNFVNNTFLGKIKIIPIYAFDIPTLANFPQFWKISGFFWKNLNFCREKTFLGYYHFICIVHQICCFLTIFENFVSFPKNSTFFHWKPLFS